MFNKKSDDKKYKVYVKEVIFGKHTLHTGMIVYAEKYNGLVRLTNDKGKEVAIIKKEEARNKLKYV
jgi:hypothetical protein